MDRAHHDLRHDHRVAFAQSRNATASVSPNECDGLNRPDTHAKDIRASAKHIVPRHLLAVVCRPYQEGAPVRLAARCAAPT